MLITVGQLRRLIKECITEAGGGNPHFPYIRDAQSPEFADREAISIMTADDIDRRDDDLAPHLRDQPHEEESDEELFGPVPPTRAGDFYAVMDPYVDDWHVIPSPTFAK